MTVLRVLGAGALIGAGATLTWFGVIWLVVWRRRWTF